MSKIAVVYIDLLDGVKSSETIELRELHFFFEDEANGEILILEVNQSFDNWDTMENLYRFSA